MTEDRGSALEQASRYRDQTWAERNDGWEHTDELGRWVGLRYSRFHGLMISIKNDTVYVDQAEPGLREWLARMIVAEPEPITSGQEPPL